MNEYDVVKNILDTDVYRLIKEVNDYVFFDKNKLGFCVNIIFYLKNFLDDNTNIKKYEIKCYFINDALKKYLLKDISRQELLLKTTILLNDDKIDVK